MRAVCQYVAACSLPLLMIAAGCDQPVATPPVQQTSTQQTSSAPVTPPAPKPEETFASVDAAVVAFKEACAARDDDRISATMKYLSQQGGSATGPMAQIANDTSIDKGTRVAATRVLALIGGPSAAQQLLAISQAEESTVRVKAAESLGSIRPSTTPIVDRLIAMLGDEDRHVQSASIRALKTIGPQAKRAAPDLQAILNSEAPEQLREEAHKALKKVAPRVGFRQGEAD